MNPLVLFVALFLSVALSMLLVLVDVEPQEHGRRGCVPQVELSVQAVQAALNKISTIILDEHLNSCLITAVRGDDPDERERVLKEISDVFEATTKV